jgi:hypothetical protein
METTATEMDREVLDSERNIMDRIAPEELEGLYQYLRTMRHAINNNVAVIMAMAELSQRNPAQCQKLSQICLEKAPLIASSIGKFSELFEGTLHVRPDAPRPQFASRV